MGARHETRSSRSRRKNQVNGGNPIPRMLSESDIELQEIYLHSLPIKEYQIVDYFLPKLKDEVMKVDSSHDDEGLIVVDLPSTETNSSWSKDSIQGICCHWRQ